MSHSDDGPVNSRISANGFGIKINGYEDLAVFPESAMLNNDCRKNAVYSWEEEETLSH
jgi:hypothetical protein